MPEYWESRFKNEGAMWNFESSNSASFALDLFKSNGIKNILIPGFGYGRNAKLFYDKGFKVTGIEISLSAIDLAKDNGLNCRVHHGSVTAMPFDNDKYEGIFCYALIHLLNSTERKIFLKHCFDQLNQDGIMIFVTTSKELSNYGNGRYLSKDRFEISKGLKVFFYDDKSIEKEFSSFGLINYSNILEPIKYMKGQEPIKLKLVVCKKK
jgi:SAM-dependent methyltransferase